jgi:hypothetical protein
MSFIISGLTAEKLDLLTQFVAANQLELEAASPYGAAEMIPESNLENINVMVLKVAQTRKISLETLKLFDPGFASDLYGDGLLPEWVLPSDLRFLAAECLKHNYCVVEANHLLKALDGT